MGGGGVRGDGFLCLKLPFFYPSVLSLLLGTRAHAGRPVLETERGPPLQRRALAGGAWPVPRGRASGLRSKGPCGTAGQV